MCPVCKSNRLRESWHNTEFSYIYEIEGGEPNKVAEIADLCPGNGISILCCDCGEKLFNGSIMAYMRHINAGN